MPHEQLTLSGKPERRPAPDFDGPTYDREKDRERLSGQLGRVLERLSDGQWHTLDDLHKHAGGRESGVSARIRDLRKSKFGGYEIETVRVSGGLFKYRLKQDSPVAAGQPTED